jgi:hypothetical protein
MFVRQGNFYLFFVRREVSRNLNIAQTLFQVIMTSSLENGSFGLRGIQYWNFLAQVHRPPFSHLTCIDLMFSIYLPCSLSPALSSPWETNLQRTPFI